MQAHPGRNTGEFETVAFADFLFGQGDFDGAVNEYVFYLYRFIGGRYEEHAQLQILRSLYLSGKRKEVLLRSSRLELDEASEAFLFDMRFLRMISWFDLYPDEPFRLRFDLIEEGLAEIDRIPARPGKNGLEEFREEWKSSEWSEDKSPLLAGTLSALLPGTGSFYAERPREGAYALILTALLYLSGAETARDGQTELSVFLYGMGLVFHAGSVYASVNSVHRRNDGLREERFRFLRSRFQIGLRATFN